MHRPRRRLRESLAARAHPVVAELPGSHGIDSDVEVSFAMKGVDAYDAVLATDIPTGRVRVDGIITAQKVMAESGLDVISAISCRHRSLEASVARLLGLWASGVQNIYVVMGDPTPSSSAKEATYGLPKSTELIRTVKSMGTGRFEVGGVAHTLPHPVDFFIGSALLPSREGEVELLRKKLDSGVDFLVTQVVFEPDSLVDFVDRASSQGLAVRVPIFATLPLPSRASSLERISGMEGVKMPPGLLSAITSSQDIEGSCFRLAVETFSSLAGSLGGSKLGSYVLPMRGSKRAAELARLLGST